MPDHNGSVHVGRRMKKGEYLGACNDPVGTAVFVKRQVVAGSGGNRYVVRRFGIEEGRSETRLFVRKAAGGDGVQRFWCPLTAVVEQTGRLVVDEADLVCFEPATKRRLGVEFVDTLFDLDAFNRR